MMINKIVWASFGPEISTEALEYAIYIAKQFGSKIYALYIKPTTYHEDKKNSLTSSEKRISREWTDYTYRENLKKIENLQNKIKEERLTVSYSTMEGVPCLEILNFANANSADLIILDKGKTFLDKCIVQETTIYIVNHTSIPVLSINPLVNVKEIKTILVPTDKYNVGAKAFNLACSFSKKLKSHIVHLNILKSHDPKIPVEEVERMHGDSYFNLCKLEIEDKNIESVVVDSENISEGIIDYTNSNEIDLIILQTYSGEKQEVFHSNGSVTEEIIQQVSCPVITIK